MCSEFDNALAYEWQDADDYPHRDDVDILEDTIGFFVDADLRTTTDARFGSSPVVTVETIQRLRRVCVTIHGNLRRES